MNDVIPVETWDLGDAYKPGLTVAWSVSCLPVITGWPAESLGSVCRGCTYMVKAY